MSTASLSQGRLAAGGALLALMSLAAGWYVIGARQVSTVSPKRGDAAEVVYATGVVEPHNWAKVMALSRKRIVEMCQCEGDTVKKGHVLARLDDEEEKSLLAEQLVRRSTIADDVQRLAGLVKRNVATPVAYDEKVTQLREIDARIAMMKDRISDLELRSPMDGVVLRKKGEVGEIAGIGEADVLFWVGEPRPLEIDAEVNEDDIAKVSVGQSVLLRHDGFPGTRLDATVSHITPKGDPETKTFSVTLALPDDTPLKIGMSVEANIIVKQAKGVLLVPLEAVLAGHVLVVDNGRIRRRAVTTGIRGSNMIEITAGLSGEEAIVSPAAADLAEGLRVRPVRSGAT